MSNARVKAELVATSYVRSLTRGRGTDCRVKLMTT